MKLSHSILTLALTSVFFVGCKDTASAPNEVVATTKKEVTVAKKPETAKIHIEGMTCAIGCAKAIEENLAKMNGVQQAKVDFDKKEATINFDLDVLTADDLVKAIEATADGKSYKTSDVKLGNKA
ncbi:MAG: heavy-metal-associated domain-containing protein [Flavobacterium sp.]|nr:heavy-metal-associated domain-containing protein [Flavobacterium sp.]